MAQSLVFYVWIVVGQTHFFPSCESEMYPKLLGVGKISFPRYPCGQSLWLLSSARCKEKGTLMSPPCPEPFLVEDLWRGLWRVQQAGSSCAGAVLAGGGLWCQWEYNSPLFLWERDKHLHSAGSHPAAPPQCSLLKFLRLMGLMPGAEGKNCNFLPILTHEYLCLPVWSKHHNYRTPLMAWDSVPPFKDLLCSLCDSLAG